MGSPDQSETRALQPPAQPLALSASALQPVVAAAVVAELGEGGSARSSLTSPPNSPPSRVSVPSERVLQQETASWGLGSPSSSPSPSPPLGASAPAAVPARRASLPKWYTDTLSSSEPLDETYLANVAAALEQRAQDQHARRTVRVLKSEGSTAGWGRAAEHETANTTDDDTNPAHSDASTADEQRPTKSWIWSYGASAESGIHCCMFFFFSLSEET